MPNFGLRNILPEFIDRRKCCQLSSTDNRHHFVTLSVHHCVQYDGSDSARGAAPSFEANKYSQSVSQ